MSGESRAWPRVRYARGVLPPDARVHPGREVIVVDLSRGGALVEGSWRFRPGGPLTLHVQTPAGLVQVRGTVERCVVHSIERSGSVRYRAAIRFDAPLTIDPPAEGPDFL